jgi:IS30 family transposase
MILNPRTSCLLTYTDRKSKYELISFSESLTKESIKEKTNELFKDIPKNKRFSFTYDNGKEFSDYEMIERNLGIDIYFAHTYASYERGTNENTNGLIREFFPKKGKCDTITIEKVKTVQDLLNHRPRKSLNYLTPYEVFHDTRCCTLDLK